MSPLDLSELNLDLYSTSLSWTHGWRRVCFMGYSARLGTFTLYKTLFSAASVDHPCHTVDDSWPPWKMPSQAWPPLPRSGQYPQAAHWYHYSSHTLGRSPLIYNLTAQGCHSPYWQLPCQCRIYSLCQHLYWGSQICHKITGSLTTHPVHQDDRNQV